MTKSFDNAKSLIEDGKVNLNGAWSFSAADGNKLLGKNGDDWAAYALWHLVEDTDAEDNTKARFKYPYGKNGEVYRRALIAIKSRATQQNLADVSSKADELLKLIDSKHDGMQMCPECEAMMEEGATECSDCGHKMGKKDRADRGEANHVTRLDVFDNVKYWMESPFEYTEEGYLKGRAIVTNVGVFKYLNKDGTTQSELRLPEDVFAYDSLESLKLKPVTNDHPLEPVTAANISKYQKGSLGNNPSSTTQQRSYDGFTPPEKITDGYYVAIDMVINDSATVADIQSGKRALSCGYTCDLEKAPPGAVWCGIPYDYIQRNIKYNHVAVVDKARAGDAAKIRLDSAEAGGAYSVYIEPSTKEASSMALKKFTIDGVERDAEDAVIVHIHQLQSKADAAVKEVDTLKASVSKLQADHDSQKERADKLDADNKVLKEQQLDQTKIDAAVQAKLVLLDAAHLAKIEVKTDSKDSDLRNKVILYAFPDAKLDGRDEVYLQARFDSAYEIIKAGAQHDSTSRMVGAGVTNGGTDRADTVDRYDSEAARQRYIKNLENRGKE